MPATPNLVEYASGHIFLAKAKTAHRGTSDSRRIAYICWSIGLSDIQILDYAEINTPLQYDGMPRTSIDIEQIYDGTESGSDAPDEKLLREQPEIWRVEPQYERPGAGREVAPDEPIPGQPLKWNYRVQTVTERIRTAPLIAIARPKGYTFWVNPDDGINLDKDKRPEGVDRLIPQVSFTIQAPIVLTGDYMEKVSRMATWVNSKPFPAAGFKQFAPGEVIFLGTNLAGPALAIQFTQTPTIVDLEFAMIRNTINPVIGGGDAQIDFGDKSGDVAVIAPEFANGPVLRILDDDGRPIPFISGTREYKRNTGEGATDVIKRGWDYLHAYAREVDDEIDLPGLQGEEGRLDTRTKWEAAYISRIYAYGDLNQLFTNLPLDANA